MPPRISLITADLIALTVSCRKAIVVVREALRFNIRVPLSDVLVRDGELFNEVKSPNLI